MVKKFVDSWEKRKKEVEDYIKNTPQEAYSTYTDLVKILVDKVVNPCLTDEWCEYDLTRIHVIDDGDYQGTQVFLVPEDAYQPSKYLITSVSYGSCSGCDTLKAISGYDDGLPNERQVKDYMTLILHILQKVKIWDNYEED